MDAIQFLKQEHQKAKAGFEELLKAAPEARGELWTKLQPELAVHEKIEDADLYEPLSHDAGKGDSTLAETEVDKFEGLLKEMGKLDPREAPWLTKLKAVHANLETHIREEEQDIFPRISKVWDEKRLERAGTAMREMKEKTLKTATEAARAKEAGSQMRKAG